MDPSSLCRGTYQCGYQGGSNTEEVISMLLVQPKETPWLCILPICQLEGEQKSEIHDSMHCSYTCCIICVYRLTMINHTIGHLHSDNCKLLPQRWMLVARPPPSAPSRSAAHSQWFVLKPQVHHQRQPAPLPPDVASQMPTMANQNGFVHHHFPIEISRAG